MVETRELIIHYLPANRRIRMPGGSKLGPTDWSDVLFAPSNKLQVKIVDLLDLLVAACSNR